MSLNKPDLYHQNTGLLTHMYPSFNMDILSKYLPSEELFVSEAADGLLTARIDDIWIHSSRAPFREAQKLVRNGIKKHTGLCLVYGFGLGYQVEAIIEHFPELMVLIIEPEPGLFLKALEYIDLSPIIKSGRVGFLFDTPADVITSVMDTYRTSEIQSLKLRSVYSRNCDYYRTVDEAVSSFIRRKETNMNTLNRFGKTWVKNLFRNIEVFGHARDSGLWYGAFSDIPAVVIAAGPSLDTFLPVLDEIHRRCVIICVDTALRAVLLTGTIPDFIVVVDPQYLNTRHLDNLLCPEKIEAGAVLISESSTHPAVFRNNNLPVFFFKSVFPLGKMIERSAGISSELGAGGSVATTAWDFARKIGCPQIFTAGLDLGYPHQNTHCRTSLSSLYTSFKSNRLTTADSISFCGVQNAEPHPLPNNAGGETLTDMRLIVYKWWFEGQLRSDSSSGRYFNLSENGIKIDGMEYCSQEKVLELPEKRKQIDTIRRETCANRTTSEPETVFSRIRLIIESIITECARLENICRDALGILEETGKAADDNTIAEGMKKLSELDIRISESPTKELTGFIIQPVLNEIINSDNSVFDNSENLYSNILEACTFHRLHAERALKRI